MASPDSTPTLGTLDSQQVATIMKALGNPVRIDLLKSLRSAKTLGEIRLAPRRRDALAREGRVINRVTTRRHLDCLLELGVVQRIPRVRDGRSLDHYLVNHRQLFALTEQIRQLASLRPDEEILEGTMPGPTLSPLARPGAKLALVAGSGEGRVFSLANREAGPWTIGRRNGVHITLDYDPFVSLENSRIVHQRGQYRIHDLGSRNGTYVNWERLRADEGRPLVSGDLVGVGRSALVFRGS